MRRARRLAAALSVCALLGALAVARAEWMQPDASYRDAQMWLREAARDTAGHGDDAAKLDTLGVALLRLGRFADATKAFDRVRASHPDDAQALASLGKLAMFAGRDAQAESLLTSAGALEGARADLYTVKLRREDWAGAATMAEEMNDQGRQALLERLTQGPSSVRGGADRARVPFERILPVPLVKVKLNGTVALMAIDTGAPGLMLDPAAVRLGRARPITGQRQILWDGARVVAGQAIAPKLEIGGATLEQVPASTVSLRKYSVTVNPEGVYLDGVIGLDVLRRFDVTLDLKSRVLELRRPGLEPLPNGTRVPFERWGETDLTVWGSLNGSRRMALLVATGLAECGVAAPASVMDEIGVKSGGMSKYVRGAGTWLQGRAWARVTVPVVTVGPLGIDKVAGWSGALDDAEMWRAGVRRDGLVGADFFRGRRVTFDWSGQALVFEE